MHLGIWVDLVQSPLECLGVETSQRNPPSGLLPFNWRAWVSPLDQAPPYVKDLLSLTWMWETAPILGSGLRF